MPRSELSTLRRWLRAAGPTRSLQGASAKVGFDELVGGTSLGGALGELRGRSVLLRTRDQLSALVALVELDGVASRIVLCPSDVKPDHLASVMRTASVDAVVSDGLHTALDPDSALLVICRLPMRPAVTTEPEGNAATEWILLTSGTAGPPKLVVHTLATLTGAIKPARDASQVWSTFYDIRRYGGLQIALRALIGGCSLIVSGPQEPMDQFLVRAGRGGVTRFSGTPTHWRRALMSPAAGGLAPRYVRLSGEVADQAILDRLRAFYSEAGVAHAFASTEAGVAFEVTDGRAGFPASFLGHGAEVEMKIEHGSLRIRSARTAVRYLGGGALADADGFVDTGDMIEQRGERCYFVGRGDGVINVGGQKVHPEEVEAAINGHPRVRMSLVTARKSPVTGAVVVADVVLLSGGTTAETETLKSEILTACRGALAPHKVPALIRLRDSLDVAESGKLARSRA